MQYLFRKHKQKQYINIFKDTNDINIYFHTLANGQAPPYRTLSKIYLGSILGEYPCL